MRGTFITMLERFDLDAERGFWRSIPRHPTWQGIWRSGIRPSTRVRGDSNAAEFDFSAGPPLHKGGKAVVTFEIPGLSRVAFKTFDLEGREVAGIAGVEYPSGRHGVEFGSRTLAAG